MQLLVFIPHGARMYQPSDTLINNNIHRILPVREALPDMVSRVFVGVLFHTCE